MDGYLQKINKWKNIALRTHSLPPFLIVFVTNKCNLRCRHCFYHENIQNRKLEDLSISEFENLSRQFGKLYNVLISGGEPFLREDLPDICELFRRNNNVEKIAIPTNGFVPQVGYRITKKIMDKCPCLKLEINLSIDGPEEIHDNIRQVKGSFNRAVESCEMLISLKEQYKNIKCYLVTTISSANVAQLYELKKFVKGRFKGIDGHRFSFFRGVSNDENIFFPVEKLREIKHIAAPSGKKDLNYFLEKVFLNAKASVLEKKKQVIKCLAGRIAGVVDNNGDIRLCELLKPVGNIRQDSFCSIWHSEEADLQRKSISQGNCYCTHECFIAPSILYDYKNLLRSILYLS